LQKCNNKDYYFFILIIKTKFVVWKRSILEVFQKFWTRRNWRMWQAAVD